MYEVTTIGGVVVPSSGGRTLGALPSFDLAMFKRPEVLTGVAAGLVLGLIAGAMLAGRR